MFKKIRIQVSPLIYSLIISIIITLFLNTQALCYITAHKYLNLFIWNITLFIWFILFSFNKTVLKLITFFTFLMLCIYDGYIYLTGSIGGNLSFKFNELTLAFIVDTNFNETSEFLHGNVGSYVSSFLLKYCLFPLFMILYLKISSTTNPWYKFLQKLKLELKELKNLFKNLLIILSKLPSSIHKINIEMFKHFIFAIPTIFKKFSIILTIVFLLFCTISGKHTEDPSLNMGKITYKFLTNRYFSVFKKYKEKTAITKQKEDDLIIVFYFGESARGDRFSLNGYSRKTNPLLEKRKNLISFKNAHSCRVSTSLSFNCVMQGYNDTKDFNYEQKGQTLYSFFKQVGFKTGFLSTGANDLSNFISNDLKDIYLDMSKETFFNEYAKTYDYKLVEMLKTFIQKNKGPKFVTMIGMGSHHDYGDRVPKEFYKFKTTDDKLNNEIINNSGAYCFILNGKSRGAVNDSYDATILYTDYVIDSIIKELEDKNAIFIYASDHGESLGEPGSHGCVHAYPSDDEQIWHIPFIVWVSDQFIEKHPEKYKNIKIFEKQVNDKKRMVSHDNIFHTLLDCASIESEALDKKFSMCQPYPIYENKFEGMSRFNKNN